MLLKLTVIHITKNGLCRSITFEHLEISIDIKASPDPTEIHNVLNGQLNTQRNEHKVPKIFNFQRDEDFFNEPKNSSNKHKFELFVYGSENSDS